MKPRDSPYILIGLRGWETPPSSQAKRVCGLAGVPGPGVSFTKVNETKGNGELEGVGERELRPRQRKCTNQLLPWAHNCLLRPENKPGLRGPGAQAASLRPSPSTLVVSSPGHAEHPPRPLHRRASLR